MMALLILCFLLLMTVLDLALTALVWRHLFQPTKEN